jgi:hypothetical protein
LTSLDKPQGEIGCTLRQQRRVVHHHAKAPGPERGVATGGLRNPDMNTFVSGIDLPTWHPVFRQAAQIAPTPHERFNGSSESSRACRFTMALGAKDA